MTSTPGAAEKVGVGVIAGQQQDGVGGDGVASAGPSGVASDLDVGRISTTRVLNRAAIDPSLIRFSMSGLTQYFTESPKRGATMDERHLRAVAIELERGFARGVLAADDHHSLPVVGVRLVVIVTDVRQVLARHAQQIRAGRSSPSRARRRAPSATRRTPRCERVSSRKTSPLVVALDRQHLFVQRDLELKDVRDLPVVLQRFEARRLVVRASSTECRRSPSAPAW